MAVSCKTDANRFGGKRIVIVVNIAALVMVTMKGAELVTYDNRTHYFQAWVDDTVDQHSELSRS